MAKLLNCLPFKSTHLSKEIKHNIDLIMNSHFHFLNQAQVQVIYDCSFVENSTKTMKLGGVSQQFFFCLNIKNFLLLFEDRKIDNASLNVSSKFGFLFPEVFVLSGGFSQ